MAIKQTTIPAKWIANPGNQWLAFAAGLAASPTLTVIACIGARQWIKASIAGGVVAGMVVGAVVQMKGLV